MWVAGVDVENVETEPDEGLDEDEFSTLAAAEDTAAALIVEVADEE